VAKDSQAAGAAVAGVGITDDSTGAAVGAAGAGKTSGVIAAGAGVAGTGKAEDSTMAAAAAAGKGEVHGSMVAGAGSVGSGKMSGVVGAGTGSSNKPVDAQDVSGSGADQAPPGHSDEEVLAQEGKPRVAGAAGRPGAERSGGAGGGAQTGMQQPAGSDAGSGAQTGAQQPGGVTNIPGATSDGKSATPGTPGTGTGGSSGQATRGTLAVIPVFPFASSEKDRAMIGAEAARVAAMLQHAQDAQKLLLQHLASHESNGQYLVPTSEWVAKLLKVTEGLTPEDIEYLKQLDWKPGQLSEEQLRERIRKALANRRQAPTSGNAAGSGKQAPAKAPDSAGGASKDSGRHAGQKPAAQDANKATHGPQAGRSPSGDHDRATTPPPDAKPDQAGVFPFYIISGMTQWSTLTEGESVPCTIRVSDKGRTFVLEHVNITFVSRKDHEVPVHGATYVETTFLIYFTSDFWSEKFKFYGLGGRDTLNGYDFGRHRKP
jgi:hypothetical protein